MQMNSPYLPRIADSVLKESLAAAGAVLIEGPKWCGKTWTAQHQAKSEVSLQNPDTLPKYLKTIDVRPSLLLKGDTPRLIDEWQVAPVLWDAVRYAVDQRGQTNQFILTGSATPADNQVMHTGTGRISRMIMRPMSLFESGESTGQVSLKKLFAGLPDIEELSSLTLEDLAYALVRGGWPATITGPREAALRRASDYVESIINTDISRVDGVDRNPGRVRALLRSLARGVASMVTLRTIIGDMASNDELISDRTVTAYMNALKRIFVIEDQPAWSPALRSRTAIRTVVKRHFVDPSIAAAVLGATPERLMEDIPTFGILFESLCIRDLRIYASAIGGDVYHYHDRNGLEADAIIQLHTGEWAAVEVKLGGSSLDSAAENLLKLADKVDADRMQKPAFLAVLTGVNSAAYRRDDGVFVIPIGCLGP